MRLKEVKSLHISKGGRRIKVRRGHRRKGNQPIGLEDPVGMKVECSRFGQVVCIRKRVPVLT